LSSPRPISPIGNTIIETPLYPITILASKVVGRRVGEFLLFLRKEGVLPHYEDVQLVGLSLGAHVVGIAGGYVKNMTNQVIGHIIGLDPAGPFHDQGLVPKSEVLDKDKADFVEIIHTGAGMLGTKVPRGHIDYFANGGRSMDQPYCKDRFLDINSLLGGCFKLNKGIQIKFL